MDTVLEAINLYLSGIDPAHLGGNALPIQDFNHAVVVMCNVFLGNL